MIAMIATTTISSMSVMSLVNDPGVEPLANDVRTRLERVLEAL